MSEGREIEPDDDMVSRIVDVAVGVVFTRTSEFVLGLMTKQRATIAAELRAELAGRTIRFGKGTDARRRQRNAAIRRDHDDGLSLPELAREYSLSRGHILRILRGTK